MNRSQKWHRYITLIFHFELVDAFDLEFLLEDLVDVLAVLLVRLPLEFGQVGLDGSSLGLALQGKLVYALDVIKLNFVELLLKIVCFMEVLDQFEVVSKSEQGFGIRFADHEALEVGLDLGVEFSVGLEQVGCSGDISVTL